VFRFAPNIRYCTASDIASDAHSASFPKLSLRVKRMWPEAHFHLMELKMCEAVPQYAMCIDAVMLN
jgi:hypothetical protein